MNARFLPALLLLAAPLAFSQQGPMPMHDQPMHHDGGPGGEHHGDMHGGPGGEHGMWWKNPEVITRLAITPDQQKKMEDIFIQSRVQLIDLHATLEKEQLNLDPLMDTNPIDQSRALVQIDKIADTRAALEKTNAKMLLGIRGVLTPEQWTKMQAHHHGEDRHGDGGPGSDHRGPMGPGGSHWNHQNPNQQPGAPTTPPPAE
jgi:Spy/CpxP family protein refolding chaperone